MYFAEEEWTLNRRVAREFDTPLNAIAFAIQQQLDHAELVIHRLGAGREEVIVPLDRASADAITSLCIATNMSKPSEVMMT